MKPARRTILTPGLADLPRTRAEAPRKPASLQTVSEHEAERQAARHRVTLDISAQLAERAEEVTAKYRAPVSGLYALAMTRLLEDIETGRVKLSDYLQPAHGIKFANFVLSENKGRPLKNALGRPNRKPAHS